MYKNKRGSRVRKVHHKLMVIDDQLIILGSFNYTGPASTLNASRAGFLEVADHDDVLVQPQIGGARSAMMPSISARVNSANWRWSACW